MVICETFGLPGSGKSFFCDKLKKEYKKYKIVSSIEQQKKSFIGKCIIKLNFKINKLKYRKLAKLLKGGVRGKINLFAEKIPPKYMIEHICYCFSLYKKNSVKLYFLDEGIVHLLSAFGAEYGLSFDFLKHIFEVIERDIKFNDIYYLEISIENALKNIKERNRHTCYIDELEETKLRMLLESYEKNMTMFYKLLSNKCVKINKNERRENEI